MFHVADLRHEGIDLDPDVPGPALKFAATCDMSCLRLRHPPGEGHGPRRSRVTGAPRTIAIPGRLVAERQDVPPQVNRGCPSCPEACRIHGWQASPYDVSASSTSGAAQDPEVDRRTVVLPEASYWLRLDTPTLDRDSERLLCAGRPVASGVELSGDEGDLEELAGPPSSRFGFPSDLPSSCALPS